MAWVELPAGVYMYTNLSRLAHLFKGYSTLKLQVKSKTQCFEVLPGGRIVLRFTFYVLRFKNMLCV